MKRLFTMFVLTRAEQRLVIFVVLALVVGAWVKHYREMRLSDAAKFHVESSPTPGER